MIKQIGPYVHYEHCRSCNSSNLVSFLNLGYVPLAGGFLTSQSQFKNEFYYPLEVCFCKNCFLVQTNNVVNKDILFKNYFYHTSAIKTLVDHFNNTAETIQMLLHNVQKPLVVEIGCNDGMLLKALHEKTITAVGVDPASNIVLPLIKKKFSIINDYFTETVANKIKKEFGKADIIFSSNTLAHIENIHAVFEGIKNLLKPEGILIFEVHYLDSILQGLQYDMIYHEHQYYYSVLALKNLLQQHNLEIFHVEPISIHAGSMRYFVKLKNSKKKITKAVKDIIKQERKMRYNKVQTYLTYGKKVLKTKKDLLAIIKKIKQKNKKIAGYGASGRSSVIMNYCDLDNSVLEAVIDDSQAKQGTYTPGMHVKIVDNSFIYKNIDYILLFAWSFKNEIMPKLKKFRKEGGKVIIPLPKPKIV
ncbi:MAG TPA: class I SAM-dependent methyltransferase [Patescibacteria group bacterium]